MSGEVQVHADALRAAARTIRDITGLAATQSGSLDTIVARFVDGMPALASARAVQQFADRWRGQFSRHIDDLDELARRLELAASRYEGSDRTAASAMSGPGVS